jgi:SET and MYND domain-containing protein
MKELATTIQVQENAIQGRHCLSTRALKKGATILTGKPYAFGFTKSYAPFICAWSLEKSEGIKYTVRCEHCKHVYYKGEAEKQHHAFWHALECEAFRKLPTLRWNTSYLMLAKVILRAIIRKALENGLSPNKVKRMYGIQLPTPAKTIPHWLQDHQTWSNFHHLVSNEEQYGTLRFRARENMGKKLIALLPEYIVNTAFRTGEEAFLEAALSICKYECNCFGYFTDAGEQIGSGVIPAISFLNHSCEPNADAMYYQIGGEISVEALRPIRKGEEVNISYCETKQAKAKRQAYLKFHYFFTCACLKCQIKKR